jgi:hypothetical protein
MIHSVDSISCLRLKQWSGHPEHGQSLLICAINGQDKLAFYSAATNLYLPHQFSYCLDAQCFDASPDRDRLSSKAVVILMNGSFQPRHGDPLYTAKRHVGVVHAAFGENARVGGEEAKASAGRRNAMRGEAGGRRTEDEGDNEGVDDDGSLSGNTADGTTGCDGSLWNSRQRLYFRIRSLLMTRSTGAPRLQPNTREEDIRAGCLSWGSTR